MRLICAFAGGCCFQVWGHGFSPTGRGAGFRKSAQFSANFTVCRLLPSCAGLSAARGLCLTSPSAIPCGQAPRHSGSCAHYAGLRVSTGRGHCIPARHAGGPAHMSGDSIFRCNRQTFPHAGGLRAYPGNSILSCNRLAFTYTGGTGAPQVIQFASVCHPHMRFTAAIARSCPVHAPGFRFS